MRFPILVIGSAPRCGSTVFVDMINQKLSLPVFLEPWQVHKIPNAHNPKETEYTKYLAYRQKTDRYILKCFLQDIEYRSPYQQEMRSGYKIGIARRNILDQVASWYIADSRKKWQTYKTEVEADYIVNIHDGNISNYIGRVSRSNFYFEHMNCFDQRVYYEDLDLKNTSTDLILTKPPKNIEELRQRIAKNLNDIIPYHWKLFNESQIDYDYSKLFAVSV